MNYIGVMSGSSLDAADAVLVDFAAGGTQIHCHARAEFGRELAQTCRELTLEGGDLAKLMRAQEMVTRVCARAANQLRMDNVAAVGCHGQTLRHSPARGWTLQILDGALLAELTGCNVVCNFRARDIAAGGQGAPLAPLFHDYFFRRLAPCAVVNLGGIANITVLQSAGAVVAYDVGPGCGLMDDWHRRHCGGDFDMNGEWAGGGRVVAELLTMLQKHPFFARAAPKSCGYEEFSLPHFESQFAAWPPRDVQATLLELTARTVAAAAGDAPRAYFCGGGARNKALLKRLKQLLPAAEAQASDEAGISATLVEAAAFAFLAKMHCDGERADTRAVTGARAPRILGAHYPA